MCLKPFLQLTPCDFGANSLLIRERELNQVHLFSVPSKIVGRSSLSDKKSFQTRCPTSQWTRLYSLIEHYRS